MMTYENIIDLIKENKNKELLGVINEHISLIKEDIDDEKNGYIKDIEEAYKLVTRSGRLATVICNNAKKSNNTYLFDGGYLAALVDEYRKKIDKMQRINAFESVYKTNINKAHWKDILTLLYKDGMVQNKVIKKETGVSASHLNKIMSNMIAEHCVTFYEFSKYKYYNLSWAFRKYLDSIGFGIKDEKKVNVLIEVHPKVDIEHGVYESYERWLNTYLNFKNNYNCEKELRNSLVYYGSYEELPGIRWVDSDLNLRFKEKEKAMIKGNEVSSIGHKSRKNRYYRHVDGDKQVFSELFATIHHEKYLKSTTW